jgi:FkbH-like protein
MQLKVRQVSYADIPRVLELAMRTHQMNSTGMSVSENALRRMIGDAASSDHMYVAELSDKYGWCGIIGIAITDTREEECCVRLFAMSCRVMGRGIERAFLSVLIEDVLQSGGHRVTSLFKETGKNRMMRAMYQMAGFQQDSVLEDETMVFTLDHNQKTTCPRWVMIV